MMEIASTKVTCRAGGESMPLLPESGLPLGSSPHNHLPDVDLRVPDLCVPYQSFIPVGQGRVSPASEDRFQGHFMAESSASVQSSENWADISHLTSDGWSPNTTFNTSVDYQQSEYSENSFANDSFLNCSGSFSPSSVSSQQSGTDVPLTLHNQSFMGYPHVSDSMHSNVETFSYGSSSLTDNKAKPFAVVSAPVWTGPISGQQHFSFQGQKPTNAQKPKRKRVINKTQRKAANQRERRRMVTLNDAFGRLKEKIPQFSTKDKKISRIDTLRLATSYIGFMSDLVNGKNPDINTSTIEKMLNRCYSEY